MKSAPNPNAGSTFRLFPASWLLSLSVGSLILCAAVACLVLPPRQKASAQAPAPAKKLGRSIAVKSVFVQTGFKAETQVLSGQVEPGQVATLSSEVSEVVMERPVQKGDRVTQGELLVGLDTRTARTTLERASAAADQAAAARRQAESAYAEAAIETQATQQQASASLQQADAGERKVRTFTRRQELRQAQAALDQTRTDEHLAQVEADRYRSLVAEGAVPQETLDQRQAALDAAVARRHSAEEAVSLAKEGARQEDIESAAAQVRTARAGVRIADARPQRLASLRAQIDSLRAAELEAIAQVRQARIDLGKHTVRAPFTGRVLATAVEIGERAVPGTPLLRIGSTDRVKVTFALPEDDRAAVALGGKVAVSADALPGRAFTGRLTALGSQADTQTRAFPIELTVANPGERLLPGMVCRLRLNVGPARRVVTVPVSATAAEDGQAYVFLLNHGIAVRRRVTLGSTDGETVQILSGLSGGELIAATPQRLTDGVAAVEEANP